MSLKTRWAIVILYFIVAFGATYFVDYLHNH